MVLCGPPGRRPIVSVPVVPIVPVHLLVSVTRDTWC